MNDDGDIILLDDDEGEMLPLEDDSSDNYLESEGTKPWKIAVVDDEEDIHSLTSMVVKGLTFFGRGVQLVNAFSGKEARELIRDNPDIALILLDVVMETDHEGLDVAEFVREDLKNRTVRIMLRTGQPGQAPELETVINYDINDYKEKTELTTKKLRVAIHTALRSYRDILAIEYTKKNLEKILRSTHELYHNQAIREFATHVLEQLTALLHLGNDALYYKIENDKLDDEYLSKEVLVGIGEFSQYTNHTHTELPDEFNRELEEVREKKKLMFRGDHYLAYFQSPKGSEHILYVKGIANMELTDSDRELIDVFCHHVGKAFDAFAPKENQETPIKLGRRWDDS
ncbi:DUF3369 domain-containing protein [Dongshaea marina]|uniref:DUF3369 domain-containing protein n=1 Tax=Dongshaea marina TaxID=2047966 RepID=UPI000D3E141A|nr:DUF3369 domain-containing protein [Dongshaea marina]